MQEKEFKEKLEKQAKEIGMHLTSKQLDSFWKYKELLLQWNEKMNLTAITDEDEIIQKHFIDSLTIVPYIHQDISLIDIGTGAGFPGIPIKIVNEDMNITLMDSLNKRLIFLEEVVKNLKLEKIDIVHARAEEGGKDLKYRQMFDVAVSRAVAPMNVLLEYLLPFVKIGGKCICMKGSNAKEELEDAKKAIEVLGGKIEKIQRFSLPNSDIERNIFIIKKVKNTPNQYPRKAGTPSKQPIK